MQIANVLEKEADFHKNLDDEDDDCQKNLWQLPRVSVKQLLIDCGIVICSQINFIVSCFFIMSAVE